MNESTLNTPHLTLVVQKPADVRAMLEGMNAADRAQVSAEWLALIENSVVADPWIHGFSVVLRDGAVVVGTCGFKGPPVDGVVEIAYGIRPDHRGRGFATEVAKALVAYAFGSGQVRIVRAHTLPHANASTRVLTKCGFRHVGEANDPEDGLVWRWEKQDAATLAIE